MTVVSTLLTRAQETRANAWNELNGLREQIASEDGLGTADQRTEWDRLEKVIVDATLVIDDETRAIELERKLTSPVVDERLAGAQKVPGMDGEQTEERVRAYGNAFRNYARYGSDISAEDKAILKAGESRAQSDGTNSAGGYLVPQDFWVRITEVLKAYGGLQGVSNQITTSDGRLLPWPKNDDTSNTGAWLGENTQVSEVDLAFTQNNLLAYTATSNLVLVSLQLLQDSAFDLDSWLPKKLGQRLGRTLAAGYMNGTGTTQPTGLLPNVTLTVTGGTGVTGAFTYNNLVDTVHKIDPAYRDGGNARWIMGDAALAALLKITDSYGHPLWQPTIAVTSPDFLLGYPLTIDQAVPAPALSAKSVLFGNFESAYVVRTVEGGTMLRLTERYADYLQVGFFGFIRTDGKPDDLNAVAMFQGAAS